MRLSKRIKSILEKEIDPAFAERAGFIFSHIEQEKPKKVLDIGSGISTPIIDVAKKLLNIYGVEKDNYFISGDFRSGDIRHALADISEAKRILNWNPQVSLDEGLLHLKNWASHCPTPEDNLCSAKKVA